MVLREEVFVWIWVVVDVREEGKDIVIMGCIDLFILGFDEVIYWVREYKRFGVDVVFVEVLLDKFIM